ncbi:chromatin associated protein KTI12 [Cylindrobasidium torrendii FP15055 ss-10]|uniref:Chromatin associated protein KTI12 n=1 Tax=Cylindrobasidium torrendii FP15055 ss-10 TaxID=1314674 RepID=A0A0D7BLC2_9AGAR|nr:chromatin associated protein KTI12 [Cylindrobasidium torrendii FP15055 ss-10]
MALITISGYPCSGKTHRAREIAEFLEKKMQETDGPKQKVVMVSEHDLGVERKAYDNSRAEKPARGTLFAALQRQLSTNNIVIVDAPNYIKGFRYQIYCAAREIKVRVATVFVVSTPDECRTRNAAREGAERYSDDTLDNMIQRYEEPNSMVRWDAPLFTVLADDTLSTSNGSESTLGEQIWRAVTAGDVKPPNGAALSQAKAPTDALFNLENTTLGIVTNIMAEQAASGALGGPVILTLTPAVPDAPKSRTGGLKIQITLPQRNITLSELQRLKRQFVTIQKKAITLGTTERGAVDWTEGGVADRFGTFLEEHLKG